MDSLLRSSLIKAARRLAAVAFAIGLAACGSPSGAPQAACAVAQAIGTEIIVPAGAVNRGSALFQPEEAVGGQGTVAAFAIDATEVTNEQFDAFVRETGYVTRAERLDETGMRYGAAVFDRELRDWRIEPRADWRNPAGDGVRPHPSAPVVAVAYEDAEAYALWRGRRLPSELEWERAARGAAPASARRERERQDDSGPWIANTWQGFFPFRDDAGDGFAGAAPVGCFSPNAIGAYDMIGNVWEWTQDWYSSREAPASFEQARRDDQEGQGKRVIKGGSHLCSPNFCARYRSGSRQPADPTLGTSHIGFRTTRSLP